MSVLLSFFRRNGTKVIGYATVIFGALIVADPILVTSIFGDRGRGAIVLAAGVLTALRGHTNTATIKDEIRVEEKAKEEIKVQKVIDTIQNEES